MKIINLDRHFNIQPNQLQEICQQWQITELALFGSVLRADFNAESDIDVLVSFAEEAKITFFDLDTIEAQLNSLNTGDRPIQILDTSTTSHHRNVHWALAVRSYGIIGIA